MEPNRQDDEQLKKDQAEMLALLKQMNVVPPAPVRKSRLEQAKEKVHKFWNTQPVPALTDEPASEHGPIDPIKTPSDVRQTPYNMPPGFEWTDLDLSQELHRQEVYTLLNENYVEDDDNMFRFDYSVQFLQWALQPPGFHSEWHVGVRNQKNGKLMAFISGIPATIRVDGTEKMMAEINFLCIHKKLRTKRLAPVLIKEITRRVNLKDIWQAVYTAGVVLPKPIGQCRYYHRSLNPKKLIEVGFSRLPPRSTMTRTIKLYRLPEQTATAGFRQMELKDVPQVTMLLQTYLTKFKLTPHLTEDEVAHWILPRPGVLDSFVVENPETGAVTDFCSFYHLPSTVIGHEKHKTLNAAYSFYNVATSVSLTDLMRDLLIKARDCGLDVFNALNLMDNSEFTETLKFGVGDGELQYYLYNWLCPKLEPEQVGLVLC